jgi:N-acetylmuramoyl-L-alanine amidase
MKPLFGIVTLLLLLSTLLVATQNRINKVFVQKNKIHFVFDKSFDEKHVKHFTLSNPKRYIYDFKSTKLKHRSLLLRNVKGVRMSQFRPDVVRVVILAEGGKSSAYKPLFFENKYYIGLPHASATQPKRVVKREPAPQKEEESGFSLGFLDDAFGSVISSSKKGLVVIDAGHGGHDSGAVGGGKREKDLVLTISKKLAKFLKRRGYDVYMTRVEDRFLTLKQRTKFADKKEAVVFLSIHANAVPKKKRHRIHGIETYFLQKTRDAKSQRVAARENRSVLKGTTQLSKNVIIDSVLTGPKIVESNKLAIDVQRGMISSLSKKYRVKDNGVKSAPFWVLVGASRPSILVEVGYISHPSERKRLFTPRYQDLLAKGIADGIDNYLKQRRKEIDLY